MVLLLTNDECKQLVGMKTAIDSMSDAYRSHFKGKTGLIPRNRMYLNNRGHPGYIMNVMAGAVVDEGFAALRVNSGFVNLNNKASINLSWKSTLILLYSLIDGQLKAIMHSDYLQKLRVGATTALATKLLTRKSNDIQAILGSGAQAKSNLEAVCCVRRPKVVKAYSPNESHLRSFCTTMSHSLGVEVVPTDSPKKAVEQASIVTFATNSREPICKASDFADAVHINEILSPDKNMKGSNLDRSTYEMAGLIVVNSKSQIEVDEQQPLAAILKKRRGTHTRILELSDLFSTGYKQFSSTRKFTIYNNNVGMGIQFASLCGYVYSEAKRLGLGRNLTDDFFDFNPEVEIGKSK